MAGELINIAIFASGSGTNAENIIRYFDKNNLARVAIVLTNNPEAGVLAKANKYGIDTFIFDRDDFYPGNKVADKLVEYNTGFIVLAGFLWLVHENIISKYHGKILNIHPALLPKFGGKGMYGGRVHKAVKENKETKTGISIHYVNEIYDAGDIIFQTTCDIDPEKDSIEEIAAKVHRLEYEYYPEIIEKEIYKLTIDN